LPKVTLTVENTEECVVLQVTLTVERSDAFQLVDNDTTSTANSASLTVCPRATETHTFRLVPQNIGQVNFTVHVSYVLVSCAHSTVIFNECESCLTCLPVRLLLSLLFGPATSKLL